MKTDGPSNEDLVTWDSGEKKTMHVYFALAASGSLPLDSIALLIVTKAG